VQGFVHAGAQEQQRLLEAKLAAPHIVIQVHMGGTLGRTNAQ
jgi:hypothetical protein